MDEETIIEDEPGKNQGKKNVGELLLNVLNNPQLLIRVTIGVLAGSFIIAFMIYVLFYLVSMVLG